MTIQEAVAAWDRGEVLMTVEMGGMGPGYEQAIQLGVIELCRRWPKELPDDRDELRKVLDAVLMPVAGEFHLGLSGAQAGAIKTLAYRYCVQGYQESLESMREHDKERLICVSRRWPGKRDQAAKEEA